MELHCRGIELEPSHFTRPASTEFSPQGQSEKTPPTSLQRVVNLEAGFQELSRGRESAGGGDGEGYLSKYFVDFHLISLFCMAPQPTLSQGWDAGFQSFVASPLPTPSSSLGLCIWSTSSLNRTLANFPFVCTPPWHSEVLLTPEILQHPLT